MCGTSGTAEDLLLVHEAGLVLDGVLAPSGVAVLAKALNLGSPRGFDRAVALLAAKLRRTAGPADAAAVRAAIGVLDVDWPATTPAQRKDLVAEAVRAAGRATAIVPAQIRSPLGEASEAVVAAARKEARRGQGLAIAADLNALDRRIARHVAASQGNFVRDEYGRRLDTFGAEARRLVAEGLEQGLGRDDLAASLERAARSALIERQPFYWEVVAAAFVGQGRSFGQMSSYAEAGIERYVIEAVLDERTTNICRFLHGKTFSVGDALQRFERVERAERPEDLKQLVPWVRETLDPETGNPVLWADAGQGRTRIAEVTRSAFGTKDDRGEFRAIASDRALRETGVGFPPFHGLCRTTTLAG